jgi:hypothetical protein
MIKKTLTLIYGLLAALASSAIVLGAISLSLAEGSPELSQALSNDQIAPFNILQVLTPQDPLPGEDELVCIAPVWWVPYTVQSGDTLANLAEPYGLSAEDLKSINCIMIDELPPGAQLLLPPN